MQASIQKILCSTLFASVFVLSLLPVKAYSQEYLPPVENVRVENNLLVWDPLLVLTPDGYDTNYNIYLRGGQFPGAFGNYGIYVATVVGKTEFRPTLNGQYSVVASSFPDGIHRFSRLSDASIVDFAYDTDTTPEFTTERFNEIRTNRCTDLSAGQSCSVACGASHSKHATGGACRAGSAVIVHQRARYDGYECITTSDTSYVEVDVFCNIR